MFLIDWVYSVLFNLGLYNKKAKMMFLGLDQSGKTTLLQVLKYGQISAQTPTLHPHNDKLIIGNIVFNTYDMGGHISTRRLWKEYFPAVSAIVFIVDAANPERFHEAKAELDGLLSIEELSNVPFLVFGSKIDIPTAVSEEVLRQELGLTFTTGKSGIDRCIRPIELFMCSIISSEGYGDGFRWLSKFID